MKLENGNISVVIDERTGATVGIYNPYDEYKMNWILNNSKWGEIEGFEPININYDKEKVTVVLADKSRNLQVSIEKFLTVDGYCEKYFLTNYGENEFFLTKDNFGIIFPYACNYSEGADVLNKCCINHVWCGGDCCWLYSVKANGKAPYLVMNVTEGRFDDYSISYDISRTRIGAFYRGAIVLNPEENIIRQNETANYFFCYRFSDVKPETEPLLYDNSLKFTADKYTVLKNEKVKLNLESKKEFKTASVLFEGKEICSVKNGNKVDCCCSFDKYGEKKIIAEIDGRKTLLYINVIPSVSELLEKRAHFIAEKQQYLCAGSHLDGAYLIYDNETDNLYCSEGENDHNACRERVGMGVVVCKALQEKYDEKLMSSLKKNREFIEREIFDTETAVVYNSIGKSHKHNRIFNYPWLSVYYLEWYELTSEKKCIAYAAKILLKFFEITECSGSAQGIEVARICNALEKENMLELKEKLLTEFLKYADNIVKSTQFGTKDGVVEVTWANELPNSNLCYHSQAFMLTKNNKYLDIAESYAEMTKAYFALQPDFHLNCIPVRYWDNYWFGKYACYGDVFPHYWSTLVAWGLAWYDMARNCNDNREIINSNLTGNLCVYREDGSARNNYLYPYKITLYSSDPNYENIGLKPQVDYGKRYDAWANDQDWAIYFASTFIK